jgi:pyridoxine 5'-phosphate synthase PdxJ
MSSFFAAPSRQAGVAVAAILVGRLALAQSGGTPIDRNVLPIAQIPEIVELNIGHSIIARAVIVGIEQAVREMKNLLAESRR